jgi:hypothetical protein
MATPQNEGGWDPVVEEKKWRESLERARKAEQQFRDQLSKSSPNFDLLCLAELDAGSQLLRPEYFVSRAKFVTHLRRLIAEPTQPSRSVPSIQAYRDSQKWWLESMIQVYEEHS